MKPEFINAILLGSPMVIWIIAAIFILRYLRKKPVDPTDPKQLGGYQPKKPGIEISKDRLSKPDDRNPPKTR